LKFVKFRCSGIVRTECSNSGTRQPHIGSMRLKVGAGFIKEGLGKISLEQTVKAMIAMLFEGFGLVVRVIHDYCCGSLISLAYYNGSERRWKISLYFSVVRL